MDFKSINFKSKSKSSKFSNITLVTNNSVNFGTNMKWTCGLFGPPFIDHASHYSSACPIKHPLKFFMSYDNQDNTVQNSSSHKCSQEVRWDTLNGVAATIHSVMSGLPSTLKLFLYSVTSSGNALLTWPCLAPSVLPSKDMVSLELHWPSRPWYNTWQYYPIQFM